MTASSSTAEIRTETIPYRDGDAACEGYLAWDDASDAKRPGVMVVHAWMGLDDYARMRCRMLAEMGYIAFAADIYGKDVRPANREEAGAQAGKYRGDRALFRSRLNAALKVLADHPLADGNRLAAIGYCFGGGGALELARSGANMAGVVSFHGNLDTPHPAKAGDIRGKVLVLHGADDPGVPPEQVQGLHAELRAAGVDYYIVEYGGAVHAFTNPAAGGDPSKGAAYNAAADRRSWKAMQDFFDEIFK